jgi:hypothetical protein
MEGKMLSTAEVRSCHMGIRRDGSEGEGHLGLHPTRSYKVSSTEIKYFEHEAVQYRRLWDLVSAEGREILYKGEEKEWAA